MLNLVVVVLTAVLVFKPKSEYWRIVHSILVNFPVQRYVRASAVEHRQALFKLKQPGCRSTVHLHIEHLAGSVKCAILLNIEIKTLFEGHAWKLEHLRQHVVFEVVVVLLDKLCVLLVRLQSPKVNFLVWVVF